MKELGVSQREVFQVCRRKWWFGFVQGPKGWGIVPTTEALALAWGRIGHEALRLYYEGLRSGASWSDLLHPIETLLTQKIIEASSPERQEPHERLALVKSFAEGYLNFYGAVDEELWEIIDIEWEFCVPAEEFYPKRLRHLCKGLPMCRGIVDLIAKKKSTGEVVVWDHKFHTRIDLNLEGKSTWWPQPLNYCRAVDILRGLPVSGFLLNQIRKPSPSLKPRITPYLESADDFLERLRQEYINYPDYLLGYPQNKKGYFHRSDIIPMPYEDDAPFWDEQIHLDREIVRAWNEGHEGWDITKPIPVDFEPPPAIRRASPKVMCEMFGKMCDYAPLCAYGLTPGTLEMFQEREEPHP